MAGNSTVHIGTWENRIVSCESFQQAEEVRRKYGRGTNGAEAELKRVRSVLENGAYIQMLDQFIPPDVSYQTCLYYMERRWELLSHPYKGG